MLGHSDLGFPEDLLQMANAEGGNREEIQDPEAGLIAEALVDFDQLHAVNISNG